MTLPDGVQQVAQYDPNSRLTQLTTTGASGLSPTTYTYGYNAADWTTAATGISGTDTITHDAQGRIIAESGPDVLAGIATHTYQWSYDGNGNVITSTADNGTPTSFTYSQSRPNTLLQTHAAGYPQPDTFYAYDQYGNTTAITNPLGVTGPYTDAAINTHLTYDAQSRPITITKLSHGIPITITLQYNADGLRSRYTVSMTGTVINDEHVQYRAGELGQVSAYTATLNADGSIKSSGSYTDTYVYDPAGLPLELLRQQNGATSRYFYLLDGRNNVVAVTDSTGKVVDSYGYDSWGEPLPDTTHEAVKQQYRYGSYWWVNELEWYWVTVRYYDPEIMRWVQPDPSEIDGVRTYVYASDDPVDAADPCGLCLILLHAEWPPVVVGNIRPPGYHLYITTTENSTRAGKLRGTTYVFEAKPQGGVFAGLIGAQLVSHPPRYAQQLGTKDPAYTDVGNCRRRLATVVSNSKPCACYIRRFEEVQNLINELDISYDLASYNSNAGAYTLLNQTDLTQPHAGGVHGVPVHLGIGPADFGVSGWGNDVIEDYIGAGQLPPEMAPEFKYGAPC